MLKHIHADCFDVFPTIENNSIDCIICDLPYNTTPCDWDKEIIPLDTLWEEYKRVIKDNGAILLFGQEPFSSKVRLSNLKWYKYDWYWQKERLTNVFQVKRRPGKVIETISVFYKDQCYYNPQKTKHLGKKVVNKVKGNFSKTIEATANKKPLDYKDDGTRYPNQILKFKRDKNAIHDTQKPLDLIKYFIKTYTNKGDLVLDNCSGSGTTYCSCKDLERNCIAIEKDTNNFKEAEERIRTHKTLPEKKSLF